MVNIGVNSERTCETWWENGGWELWQIFTKRFFYVEPGRVVDLDTAKRFKQDAEKIPGWNEEPLTFTEIN